MGQTEKPSLPSQHLLSENVFLDTEAFIRCRFNFSDGQLAKLAEFAKVRRIRILTTEITRREVIRHMDRRAREVVEAARKDAHILRQAGVDIGTFPDVKEALRQSQEAFETYLKSVGAVTVPLEANLDQLVDDYFEPRAPFSERKRDEFPDAIVAASLRAWCKPAGLTAYIVSGDKDFDELCGTESCFHKVESVAEILTHASVSEELHLALAEHLGESEELARLLEEEIIGFHAETSGSSRHYMPPISAEGRVIRVKIDDITAVNVIDSRPPSYACAIEFEAKLVLKLEITNLSELDDRAYEVTFYEMTEPFSAEVRVTYSGGSLRIETVAVDETTINLDNEVDEF